MNKMVKVKKKTAQGYSPHFHMGEKLNVFFVFFLKKSVSKLDQEISLIIIIAENE